MFFVIWKVCVWLRFLERFYSFWRGIFLEFYYFFGFKDRVVFLGADLIYKYWGFGRRQEFLRLDGNVLFFIERGNSYREFVCKAFIWGDFKMRFLGFVFEKFIMFCFLFGKLYQGLSVFYGCRFIFQGWGFVFSFLGKVRLLSFIFFREFLVLGLSGSRWSLFGRQSQRRVIFVQCW